MFKITIKNLFKFPKQRFGFPFGIKLALIVTIILLGSIWTITSLMAWMVGSEFVRTAENTNFDINNRAAAGIRERLYKVRSQALMLLDMDDAFKNNPSQAQQIRNIFFEREPDIAAILIPDVRGIFNQSFLNYNMISLGNLAEWLAGEPETISQAKKGVPVIKNASPALGINLLALFYPWQEAGMENVAVIFFSPENLSEISGTGSSSTLVINGDGDVLIHSDFNQVLSGMNIAESPLVDALRKAPGGSIRLSYTEDGNRFVSAGQLIPFAETAVFSSMEYSLITEQITGVTRRNIYLSVTVLFLSILVTWFFSRTFTNPVRKLIAAAGKVGTGNFNTGLVQKSKDEIGALTGQFIKMSQELENFIKTRDLTGRFNNQKITEKTIQGEIYLKGEFRNVVILSVDFLAFDEISQKLEAFESLEMLNEFFAKITGLTEKTNGLVDKVTGSRLIAIWGVLSSEEIIDELMNCLKAVISMRTMFWELNTERESKNLPLFRMGCGIQTGSILAGCMGTPHSSQYTVTGKTLEEAIAAGAACSAAGVDIVITDTVKNMAGTSIITDHLVKAAPVSGNTASGNTVSKKQKKGKKKHEPEKMEAEKTESPFYGLVNLSPQGQEKPRWPFTLEDVRESLRKRGPVQKTENTAENSPAE